MTLCLYSWGAVEHTQPRLSRLTSRLSKCFGENSDGKMSHLTGVVRLLLEDCRLVFLIVNFWEKVPSHMTMCLAMTKTWLQGLVLLLWAWSLRGGQPSFLQRSFRVNPTVLNCPPPLLCCFLTGGLLYITSCYSLMGGADFTEANMWWPMLILW